MIEGKSLTAIASEQLPLMLIRPDGGVVDATENAALLLGFPGVSELIHECASGEALWFSPSDVVGWLTSNGVLRDAVTRSADGTGRNVMLWRCPGTPDGNAILLVADATGWSAEQVQNRQFARTESIASAAGAIGHKINNLLAGLFGYVTLLRRELKDPPGSAARYLNSLDETGKQFHELTRQLMTIAQKNVSFPMQPTDIGAAAHTAVARCIARKPDLPITLDVPETPTMMQGNAEALRGALEHFVLSTAAVFGECSGVSVSVVTSGSSPEMRKPSIRISMIHQHRDVEPIARERLFDAYFTADGKGRGAELHLVHARGVIVLHKGVVRVFGGTPSTTRVEITLPAL
jgi:signal transduction histidine kinase